MPLSQMLPYRRDRASAKVMAVKNSSRLATPNSTSVGGSRSVMMRRTCLEPVSLISCSAKPRFKVRAFLK